MAAVEFYATGSFAHIPAYMPSETSCVASTTLVLQVTITTTNDYIPVKAPLPRAMQNDNGTHQHSGDHDNDDDDDDDDNNIVMGSYWSKIWIHATGAPSGNNSDNSDLFFQVSYS